MKQDLGLIAAQARSLFACNYITMKQKKKQINKQKALEEERLIRIV